MWPVISQLQDFPSRLSLFEHRLVQRYRAATESIAHTSKSNLTYSITSCIFFKFIIFLDALYVYTMSLLHCSKLKNGAVGLNTQSISLETQA